MNSLFSLYSYTLIESNLEIIEVAGGISGQIGGNNNGL